MGMHSQSTEQHPKVKKYVLNGKTFFSTKVELYELFFSLLSLILLEPAPLTAGSSGVQGQNLGEYEIVSWLLYSLAFVFYGNWGTGKAGMVEG